MKNFNKRFGWGIKHSDERGTPRRNFLWLYIFYTRSEAIKKAEEIWGKNWRWLKRNQNLSAVKVCLFEVSKADNLDLD